MIKLNKSGMKANEAREVAKTAMQPEIDFINLEIEKEAKKGKTSTILGEISAGAIAYFKDNGYEIQTYSA